MKVQTKRNEPYIDTNRIVISIGETEFRISENKLGELVVNKHSYDNTTMQILPQVSNEIILK